MSLIGPVSFKPGATTPPELGDFITSIVRQTPNPITVTAINRDFSDVPDRGHSIQLNAVEQDLSEGTLWRWLYEHSGEQDVPVEWATKSDGPVKWTGIIAVVPDPPQGGQANQHGAFQVTIPLKSKPTLVDTTP